MSSMPKTDNENLADLQNNILHKAATIHKLTEVEQVNLENEWTEFLKNLVDYCNNHYLKLCDSIRNGVNN